MKQRKSSNTSGLILIGLFLLILLFHSTIPTAARHLLSSHYPSNGEVKANDQRISSHADSLTEMKDERDMYKVKGFEEDCEEVEEECVGRRMIAEAHLDYIYTQAYHGNHKTAAPPP